MRLALAVVFLASAGCGKQLNSEFCDAHPGDERCRTTVDAPSADAAPDVMVDAGPIEGCPSDYDVVLPGSLSRYKIVNTTATWAAAAAMCGTDQMTTPYTHLVVLSNDAERLALMPHMDRERAVGHTDIKTEGTWLPLTSEPDVYPDIAALAQPPWAVGEPNNSGNCAVLDTVLELRDRECTAEVTGFVCECDPYPHDSNNW